MIKKIKTYFVSLSDRLLSYFFPIFLLFAELILRSALKVNSQEFIGPTLASVGAGMMITLINFRNQHQPQERKKPTPDVQKFLDDNGYNPEPKESDKVKVFTNFSLIFTLILTLLWIWSVTLSTQSPPSIFGGFPAHYYPGAISFLIGIVFSEIRETL